LQKQREKQKLLVAQHELAKRLLGPDLDVNFPDRQNWEQNLFTQYSHCVQLHDAAQVPLLADSVRRELNNSYTAALNNLGTMVLDGRKLAKEAKNTSQ